MESNNPRSLRQIERDMSSAQSYEEWFDLARQHDRKSGAWRWREKKRSNLFDYDSINKRLQNLRRLKAGEDDQGLLFALHEGIHGNMAGMGRPKLYERAKSGTKHLIEDYVREISRALDYLSPREFPGISWTERHEFFKRASHCYGRSALMLSGGGTMGNFHLGVLKALIDRELCPVVISGASAGACIAGIVGTHTDAEFLDLFADGYLAQQLTEANTRVMKLSSGKTTRIDADVLKGNLEHLIPDMTFLEAYEETGRSINISVSPAEPRQNSRLLNHIASPNVTIHSAILASSALPGVLPAMALEARDVNGKTKPYLPSRRWIDGSFSHDLPAKRLARMYGVNHFIVSQVLPGLGRDPDSNDRVDRILWVAYLAALKQMVRGSSAALQRHVRVGPRVGTTLNAINSLLDQRFTGDVNIFPGRDVSGIRKFMKTMSEEETADLVKAGERATWEKIPMIETTTTIGRTLDRIMLEFEIDEAHWLSSAPRTEATLAEVERVSRKRPSAAG